jgi:hypothetical protein
VYGDLDTVIHFVISGIECWICAGDPGSSRHSKRSESGSSIPSSIPL